VCGCVWLLAGDGDELTVNSVNDDDDDDSATSAAAVRPSALSPVTLYATDRRHHPSRPTLRAHIDHDWMSDSAASGSLFHGSTSTLSSHIITSDIVRH